MEVYEIVAIFIGIVLICFSIMSITSIFYCIYMGCQGFMNPGKVPSLDKSAATEKSTYHSNQFPQVVTEKVNRNLLLVPAPTYV